MPEKEVIASGASGAKQTLRPGFTLIELLVAMGFGAIVSMAMVLFFVNTNRSYLYQDEMVVMNQNLRLAMDNISRDVRMAGSGFGLAGGAKRVLLSFNPPAGPDLGVLAVYPKKDGTNPLKASDGKVGIPPVNGTDGQDSTINQPSDSISLFAFSPSMGAPIGGAENYTGATKLAGHGWSLDTFDASKLGTTAGQVVAVPLDDGLARLFVTSGTGTGTAGSGGSNYGFDVPIDATSGVPKTYNGAVWATNNSSSTGHLVYALGGFFWNHYYIDRSEAAHPRLKLLSRNSAQTDQDDVVIATDIEDLQFQYHTDGSPALVENIGPGSGFNFDTGKLYAVNIAVVARTASVTPLQGGGKFRPISVYNHQFTSADPSDLYRRRSLETMVTLRNER